MTFRPGAEWNGNRSGRTRKTREQIEFEKKCREWAHLNALGKLKKAADSDKAVEIIAAVREILDRGFGKAETISYVEANVTGTIGASPEEFAREIEELLGPEPCSLPGNS